MIFCGDLESARLPWLVSLGIKNPGFIEKQWISLGDILQKSAMTFESMGISGS